MSSPFPFSPMTSDCIPIVLGIVLRDGRVLVARRPAGVHLGDLWEFPGGRLEAGESPRQTLAQELQEEVGIVTAIPHAKTTALSSGMV